MAVPAYKAHAFPRVYGKADAIKKHLLAVGFFDIRNLEHFLTSSSNILIK